MNTDRALRALNIGREAAGMESVDQNLRPARRHQAAIRLAHILGIGVLGAEALILIAERTKENR